MKRRNRSSPSLSRGAAARAPLIGLAATVGLAAAACSSDLFHDTKWQSRCDVEPDVPTCPQGTAGASGTSSASTTSGGGADGAGGNSSTSSASTTSGAGRGGGSTTSTTSSATAAASSSTG